jgi:putative endopeptidase
MKPIFLSLLFITLLAGCSDKTDKINQSHFDFSGMDTTVSPGDDFFQYANGGWMKTTKIPDDQNGWGSFYTLYEDNLMKLKSILEEVSAKTDHPAGSAEQKVGDFYASGMDTAVIEKKGYEPLANTIQKINAAKDYRELILLVAENIKYGNEGLIGFYVGADEKNSSNNILSFYQTGTSLPDKDYYTKADSITILQRKKFVDHVAAYFKLTGMDEDNATLAAADVLQLETRIAAEHLSPVELRNPQKNYNKMSRDDLKKLSPALPWDEMFTKMEINTDSVNVSQPKYLAALGKLLSTQPFEVLKSKVKYDFIAANASLLSRPFRDEQFAFNRVFSGIKKQPERWKQIVNNTDEGLSDLLGQVYIKKNFTPEAKQRMDELVSNLIKAFDARLSKLSWMGDTTKQKAKDKLNAIIRKIGYPDKWKTFDDVKISRDDYFGNWRNIALHNYREETNKIGKKVDKTEWDITAPTVNAFYNPTLNEIVFPAGILQSPFFNMNADDAINYGAIGVVIGHEITHGFDDQGRQYDASGNLTDWWTPNDAALFNDRAKGVITQYSGYKVLDSLSVNGELTLGENLADIGGMAIAWDAFKMTDQGKSEEKIDGFTPEQRFFLGYAQVWRLVTRPESMRTRITNDPHSPEEFRVNGPLSNFEPFYKAFGLTEKNKLYRAADDRAVIW